MGGRGGGGAKDIILFIFVFWGCIILLMFVLLGCAAQRITFLGRPLI